MGSKQAVNFVGTADAAVDIMSAYDFSNFIYHSNSFVGVILKPGMCWWSDHKDYCSYPNTYPEA